MRRAIKAIAWVVGGYVAIVALFTVGMLAAVFVARLIGEDPRIKGEAGYPDIKHLRKSGEKLLVGAQATREHYQVLADLGVTLVVNLRTGSDDDPLVDDPDYLASLGMDYLWLPVPDGHVPDEDTVARFVDAVEQNDGLVFMHCGGGVGRSTTLQAAHEASQGHDPSIWEYLAIGPPSLEQMWYIADADTEDPTGGNGVITTISRVLDAPRRLFSRLRK